MHVHLEHYCIGKHSLQTAIEHWWRKSTTGDIPQHVFHIHLNFPLLCQPSNHLFTKFSCKLSQIIIKIINDFANTLFWQQQNAIEENITGESFTDKSIDNVVNADEIVNYLIEFLNSSDRSPVRVPYRTYGAVLVPRFGIFDLSRFYSTNSPRISRDENYYV